ncbi:MAG: LysM peptidoglycan-binding domain-containing protein [Bacilli bacterium]|nr:LysM peptidoglycan-binding domain-containing protein [Bacilli bacterium]
MSYKYIIIDPGHGGIDYGYMKGNRPEKDFNLEVGKKIYYKLNQSGYPVFMTRDSDITLSNYDRYEYINNLVRNDSALVILIKVSDENKDNISIIRSIKSVIDSKNDIYDVFKAIGEVKKRVLINDNSKDYYAVHRVAPLNSDVIVLEFGYNYLLSGDNNEIINSVSNILISHFEERVFDSNIYDSYVVEKGDYLYKLAKRFNTNVDVLKKINNLGTDFLNIGEVLKVPKLMNDIYIVKNGDSLYSIAKKFNTDVNKIKDINSLISNKLMINQKLIIPR